MDRGIVREGEAGLKRGDLKGVCLVKDKARPRQTEQDEAGELRNGLV